MSYETRTIGINLTRTNARKIAGETFFKNKKCTQVRIKGHQAIAVFSYMGQRSDEMKIRENAKLLRVVKLDEVQS